jgi:hypothetical protein
VSRKLSLGAATGDDIIVSDELLREGGPSGGYELRLRAKYDQIPIPRSLASTFAWRSRVLNHSESYKGSRIGTGSNIHSSVMQLQLAETPRLTARFYKRCLLCFVENGIVRVIGDLPLPANSARLMLDLLNRDVVAG